MATARDIAMSGGSLVITGGKLQLVSDLDAIRQSIEIRLSFVLGEWFADLSEGVPFFEVVWQKNPNMVAVREVLRKAIASAPGVVEVEALEITALDTATRNLRINFTAKTDAGLLVHTVTVEG